MRVFCRKVLRYRNIADMAWRTIVRLRRRGGLKMTEAEEFNRSQSALFELMDNEDIEFMFEPEEFADWVERTNSKRGRLRTKSGINGTIVNCRSAFVGMGGYLSIENLKAYKRSLQDNDRSPNHINNRLNALSNYSKFLAEKYGNPFILKLTVPRLSVQPKQYIDNVISRADYDFLVEEAKKHKKNPNLYLAVRIMGTTGVRFCELLQVKVEHIRHGCIDVLGKGVKRRRVYFPKRARTELLEYLSQIDGGDSGYVMRYWSGKQGEQTGAYEQNTRDCGDFRNTQIFQRSFQNSLRRLGIKLGLDEDVMHAHGFRHFFAKEFLKHRCDISLLADLLGHSSLDITRIYLKMTSREQADVIDEVVEW